jgi:acetyltransferase-like isoleucine patch superfamily enzyme
MIYRAINKSHTIWLSITYPFARFGKGVSIKRSCEMRRSFAKYVSIGERVTIEEKVWINIVDAPRDDVDPILVLEDGCIIGRRSVISAKNHIHIGRHVLFGPSAFVTDHNHAFEDVTTPIRFQGTTPGGTVRIEDGGWIGFGAAIVGNVGSLVIGPNSVIGANALVSGSVPPFTVVVGNPARPARHYDLARQQWLMGGRTLATGFADQVTVTDVGKKRSA